MEQRKVVHELRLRILLLLPERRVAPDKTTLLQRIKHAQHASSLFHARSGQNLVACHPAGVSGQRTNNLHVSWSLAEKG